MKMIIAILENTISEHISQALLSENFRVTQLATTSGILRDGDTTLMVGSEDHLVNSVLNIIRKLVPESEDPNKKQATLYVLNVRNFDRL